MTKTGGPGFYKIKLVDSYQFDDNKNGRFKGCGAKKTFKGPIRFKLPEFEKDGKTKLCGSINTKDLKVIYELRCFVKHDSFTE